MLIPNSDRIPEDEGRYLIDNGGPYRHNSYSVTTRPAYILDSWKNLGYYEVHRKAT